MAYPCKNIPQTLIKGSVREKQHSFFGAYTPMGYMPTDSEAVFYYSMGVSPLFIDSFDSVTQGSV